MRAIKTLTRQIEPAQAEVDEPRGRVGGARPAGRDVRGRLHQEEVQLNQAQLLLQRVKIT